MEIGGRWLNVCGKERFLTLCNSSGRVFQNFMTVKFMLWRWLDKHKLFMISMRVFQNEIVRSLINYLKSPHHPNTCQLLSLSLGDLSPLLSRTTNTAINPHWNWLNWGFLPVEHQPSNWTIIKDMFQEYIGIIFFFAIFCFLTVCNKLIKNW